MICKELKRQHQGGKWRAHCASILGEIVSSYNLDAGYWKADQLNPP